MSKALAKVPPIFQETVHQGFTLTPQRELLEQARGV
jgi:hypothetical protein